MEVSKLKTLGQTNFESEKLVLNFSWSEQILGSKINFESGKNVVSEKSVLSEKRNFGLKKCWVRKKIWFEKILGLKNV